MSSSVTLYVNNTTANNGQPHSLACISNAVLEFAKKQVTHSYHEHNIAQFELNKPLPLILNNAKPNHFIYSPTIYEGNEHETLRTHFKLFVSTQSNKQTDMSSFGIAGNQVSSKNPIPHDPASLSLMTNNNYDAGLYLDNVSSADNYITISVNETDALKAFMTELGKHLKLTLGLPVFIHQKSSDNAVSTI
ncbi:hypothetical protein L1267_19060 [Pseudoalteromonas sp. OFAV1]|jgi:hypothetical protein|uniref:hypothetical protein n=1 Tax=Pseudoalteromonas sp. OFAV1 TaxID=2908892 RepID=UPI001F1C0202|nr:hypothetical protein [Pseudoalteromonas sp. OFAV1]MCF2902474.1 hypothetical protein [Pseudoalteromonas sp. OFAV1]